VTKQQRERQRLKDIRWIKTANAAALHMMEALKSLARLKCRKRNCGTVCLCAPCHARKALEFYDPLWRP
jgi:hypothetical protein